VIAMEPPISFDADAVRAKKTELFQDSSSPENALGGRYGGGIVLARKVPAYRRESNLAVDSGTETYVAVRLDISHGWPHTTIRP
jgi:glucose-6-phosphate 1-dehydrogenase